MRQHYRLVLVIEVNAKIGNNISVKNSGASSKAALKIAAPQHKLVAVVRLSHFIVIDSQYSYLRKL